MALPVGVTTCTISGGRYFDASGTDYSVTATVIPQFGSGVDMITWTATGESMLAKQMSGSATEGATYSVVVPHVNQAGWIDPNGNTVTMWSYKVTLTSGDKTVTKYVQPLVGQTNIDIDLIPGGSAATPSTTPLAVVTSIGGMTGVVTIDALAALLPGGSGTGAVDAEQVRDIIGATVVGGSGITVTNNDAGDVVTITIGTHTHPVANLSDVSLAAIRTFLTAANTAAALSAVGAQPLIQQFTSYPDNATLTAMPANTLFWVKA